MKRISTTERVYQVVHDHGPISGDDVMRRLKIEQISFTVAVLILSELQDRVKVSRGMLDVTGRRRRFRIKLPKLNLLHHNQLPGTP